MRTISSLTALALASGAVAVGLAAPAVAADRPVVLDRGHIDLFEVTYDQASAGLALQIKDDTGLHDPGATFRDPADVTIAVDDQIAALEVPAAAGYAFLGAPGDTVYMLPQTQNHDLPWPGWSTERLPSTLPAGIDLPAVGSPVELEVEVDGPGEVHSFMNDSFGGVEKHYVDSSDGGPDVIPISRSAHVHTNWTFSEKGDYTFEVTPRATTTGGGTLSGPTASYHIRVGDPAPADVGVEVTPNKPDATYLYGQGITLTAAPTTETDLDHYHWFIKAPGGADYVISNRSSTGELKLPTSLVWDGAQVYASLYDHSHNVVASSEPLTLHVSQLPQVTTLTAQTDKASYAVGDTAHLSSTQSPATGEDHFHWYVRKPGEEFFTYIPDSNQATADLPITADLQGAEVVARIFDHDHAVIAESAPVVLSVGAGQAVSPPPAAGKAASQVSVTVKPKRLTPGMRGKVKVAVTVPLAPGAAVTGKVVVRDGGKRIGTGTVKANGKVVVKLPRLKAGKHKLKVVYKGDASTERSSTTQVVKVRR
ncbi:choice-of-anchor M domain-containing protein [Nocardioides sp. LHD-245]|uniref:choice-of-anchor M domain-containing protein n=1 Tax=Nocardioides sp. LHD-245 TaxID=3051387 RepID=UPI0027DEACC9|nr:choice-of-anchor M domain-containing protein [Nocardioides sp. LHD-245]